MYFKKTEPMADISDKLNSKSRSQFSNSMGN